MSVPQGHKNYSAADIERYHKGMMTAQERHALEKAALDDPFLADALEGYTFTTTPAADLDSIKRRVFAEEQPSKVIPFFQKYNWIKMAALFLVIASGGWFIIHSVNNQKDISQAVSVASKTQHMATPAPAIDSVASKEANVPSITANPSETDQIISTKPVQEKRSLAGKKKRSVNPPVSISSQDQMKEKPNAPALANVEETTLASTPAKKKEALQATAAARSRSFQADDSNPAVVTIPQTETRQGSGDTIRNFNVVLQPDQAHKDIEIVQLKSNHAIIARPSPRFETLEPAEGWMQFNEYIAENLKEPGTYKEKPETGDVELAFDINPEGEPVNITVARSLCAACDKKAIELLKQGPKWKNVKNKKGKVTFHF